MRIPLRQAEDLLMSLDATQLRQMVIKPVLEKLGLWSVAAEELVLGTTVVERSLNT